MCGVDIYAYVGVDICCIEYVGVDMLTLLRVCGCAYVGVGIWGLCRAYHDYTCLLVMTILVCLS
jgi:hypothetical protein